MKTKYLALMALLAVAIMVRVLPRPPFEIAFGRGDRHVGVSVNVILSWILLGIFLLLACIDIRKRLLRR